MEYLHNNKQLFLKAISLTSNQYHILPIIVEKDYYVSMILRKLSENLDFIVFKGGTSLSKCHQVIKRFSEDIDITIDSKLSQSQAKFLKETIKSIAKELNLLIPNIQETHSRRSYNRYILQYQSVLSDSDDAIQSAVLLETSFAEIAFPTVLLPVHSYIGEMMRQEAPEQLNTFLLEPFQMKVQGIERTLVDKIFAICDYYMQDKVKNHSRHIYDIHKLFPLIQQNKDFINLFKEVRCIRSTNKICPSAQPEINIPKILKEIVEKEVYKEDYEKITARILEESVSYTTAITTIQKIAESHLFE